jgi:flagellar basal-body rod protein FlgB
LLNDISVLGMIQRGMSWMSRNHDVVATNIANADTPDFEAKELKALDFGKIQREQIGGVEMARTAPGHLVGLKQPSHGKVRINRDTYEISSTGNSVNLEEQGVKIARNAMDYQLATSLYSKSVGMVRAVISQNR